MKLLLQVIFVQGWLWRDRFPEEFAKAKAPGQKMDLLTALPVMVILIGVVRLTDAGWSRGVPLLVFGLSWLLWRLSSLGLDESAGNKALRLSAMWSLGFVFLITLLGSIGIALIIGDWIPLPLEIAALSCWGSGWLRALQWNYLFFRDPAHNMWRLEAQPSQTGFVRPLINLWVEAYWRLPREILFGSRDRATSGGARR